MRTSVIVDKQGIVHGVKTGWFDEKAVLRSGTGSWCGTPLVEWVRRGGEYRSTVLVDMGYEKESLVTCLACNAEGP